MTDTVLKFTIMHGIQKLQELSCKLNGRRGIDKVLGFWRREGYLILGREKRERFREEVAFEQEAQWVYTGRGWEATEVKDGPCARSGVGEWVGESASSLVVQGHSGRETWRKEFEFYVIILTYSLEMYLLENMSNANCQIQMCHTELEALYFSTL